MTYQSCIDWLFQQLPMYQSKGASAYKADLNNSLKLDNYLNNPHRSFKSIHVGGTNGKGSVSHMLASVLQTQGYKVGLYTSPHLKDFRERIKVNGKCISKKAVVEFVKQHQAYFEKQSLSFFEMTVGLAFTYFNQQKVDIAIIEVGLGGRLDSTNIISPVLSIITNIGLDHTQFLGDTHAQIASEKAGIIKPKTPIVIGETQLETETIFKAKAKAEDAPIYLANRLKLKVPTTDLRGSYQYHNAKTAVCALKVLQELLGYKISKENITHGFLNVIKNTGLLGRWQILGESPKIIADTAHNFEGLSYVIPQLQKLNAKRLHIVIGVVNDKDLSRILPLFPRDAEYYFVSPKIQRALVARQLQLKAKAYKLLGKTYSSVQSGFLAAQLNASSSDVIYIGGSTFTVAEVV
ncbi:bifunctional folylpolyglutamate synthase/dihydrofolate synthase [Psychroflexus sp. ALD_RP9]|uniref:bifunctional folylpolyglutamate synthase/dihydrofolate synthase n=1 Tax=Psychroflexus sp. ALD_RP9 TaxID=2777186 RepID=UPI001A8EF38E|nr:folylpolyglutamate synthase/dihydrofolate synthase family protein [Psychroflexus sp. ALD_RP9]QSS97821.1 bifunctional folylpolyglutamate synthase/dihydrofolate synthase [Psychroflexus sp. ALD_RP9]